MDGSTDSPSVRIMCIISLAERAAEAFDELPQTVIGGTSRRHCFQLRRSSNNRDWSEREFSRWFHLTGDILPFLISSSSTMTKDPELQIKPDGMWQKHGFTFSLVSLMPNSAFCKAGKSLCKLVDCALRRLTNRTCVFLGNARLPSPPSHPG